VVGATVVVVLPIVVVVVVDAVVVVVPPPPADEMRIEYAWVKLTPFPSVIVIVIGNVPAANGVP
jgi:hypothetical protein